MYTNNRVRLFLLGIGTFIFYILFSNLLPITDPVESNYALTAKEMLLTGNFISPLIYGHAWYDKPPITYWGLMASFKLFGFSDMAARLPAALTAGFSAMALYSMVKRILRNEATALWSAIVLITSMQFWYISHAVITDGYLFLFSIGIFGFSYIAFTEHSPKHMVYAYISAALAVLTKGPVGLVLPGLILIIFLLIRRQKKDWKILFNPLGLLAFVVVAAPWYLAMYNIHGSAFIQGFLGLHNVTRATVSEHPRDNVWYYYLVLWPAALLPWLGFTLYEFKHTRWAQNELVKYMLTWGCAVIIFYTLMATKYITYTFIAFIPFVIFTGQGVVRFMSHPPERKSTRLLIAYGAFIFFVIALWGGSYADALVLPLYMTIVAPLVLLLTIVFSYKLPSKFFPKIIAVGTIIIFLVVPFAITPLMNARSGKELSTQLALVNPKSVYFYQEYNTAYVYYSGNAAVLLRDSYNTGADVWASGKEVMPILDIPDFDKKFVQLKGAAIIVPEKYIKKFQTLPLYSHLKWAGRVYDSNIFILQ